MASKGCLYMIPCPLGSEASLDSMTPEIMATINKLQYFIVENEKAARRFIKHICPEKNQIELKLYPLNKFTAPIAYTRYLDSCEVGVSVGLISDAGCPGVADPGANIVALAHQKNIEIKPLVGPSSLLLALMASGLNGQQFAFHGYLPIKAKDRTAAIKKLERIAQKEDQTQLFIETPYRNIPLLEALIQNLKPDTLLTFACDLTLPTQWVKTYPVSKWKKITLENFHKRPAVFLIHR